MPKVALNDATIADTTASGHISYERYEPIGYDSEGNPYYGWVGGYTTSATVKGKCIASSSRVFINGKNPILQGDRTSEDDQYSIPSGRYAGGAHTNATGSVTAGNTKNVFVGGKLIATEGSRVNTHAGSSTTVNGGVSSNVNIGG